eukprot:6190859-Pleurochrysis_carterae.AAC.1
MHGYLGEPCLFSAVAAGRVPRICSNRRAVNSFLESPAARVENDGRRLFWSMRVEAGAPAG